MVVSLNFRLERNEAEKMGGNLGGSTDASKQIGTWCGFRVQGSGVRVQGSGFRVWGAGWGV
jgi:hypothetical protein